MPTSLNEASLESVIESHLVNTNGYAKGKPVDYDRTLCLDVPQLLGFLEETQPEVMKKLGIVSEGAARNKFLARLSAEIRKRGVIDVLRGGFGQPLFPASGPVTSSFRGLPQKANSLQQGARNRAHLLQASYQHSPGWQADILLFCQSL